MPAQSLEYQYLSIMHARSGGTGEGPTVLEDALKLPARAPGYLSIADINLWLDWYIQNRLEFAVPKKPAQGNRDAKCELLKEAVIKSMTYSAQLPSGIGQQQRESIVKEKEEETAGGIHQEDRFDTGGNEAVFYGRSTH
ncbi:hypothetical protein BT96DRAFT_936451 [Gymnopus androsaceus JB14]|uniref:Uncharacterized protein n=1 Tax=Gymnopus androsaceus JB14 TaxID=1447944 RepID=A0A6A4I3J0_9AGAR|nr:hypothetical protein BT96DRAFT_936451 [Gymnopus androsaceus JB14]